MKKKLKYLSQVFINGIVLIAGVFYNVKNELTESHVKFSVSVKNFLLSAP